MTVLILGSSSPRRLEILNQFHLPFEQLSPTFDEESIPFRGDPQRYVSEIATGKANSLLSHYPNRIILTADTTVYLEGKIYGKPSTEEEAYQYLSELNGRWHSVYTALVLAKGGEQFERIEETRVLFNRLTANQITRYLHAMDWHDKAGGYAIQLTGGLIVEKIDGCYYNVLGFPINAAEHLLKRVGVDLWDYIG